jgi:hypothetical protein
MNAIIWTNPVLWDFLTILLVTRCVISKAPSFSYSGSVRTYSPRARIRFVRIWVMWLTAPPTRARADGGMRGAHEWGMG